METPDPSSLDYLLQSDIVDGVLPLVGREQWQSLYLNGDDDSGRLTLWCALLDDEAAVSALASDGWDLMIGDGVPGFTQCGTAGEMVTEYHRFGGTNGKRALVHYRSFSGSFPDYCEMDEEFRLYHGLAHDQSRGLLLDFDSSGREIKVVRITDNEVKIRLKYIRQFQAGTRWNLAIYVDSVRYSNIPLTEAGEQHDGGANNRARWTRDIAACDFHREYTTFSRVLGKVILTPPEIEKAGVWPFEEDTEAPVVSFVIDIDEDGRSVEFTSDPSKLANYFGANPEAPNYLTSVYFRREVLAKYFAEPERYTVSDGRLSCLGLWSCRIDNDLTDYVVVFLGDLGRYLPYEERLHWRQFNIPPERGGSETNFRRSFLAQFTEPKVPDLVFKNEYERFSTDWLKKFRWPFFLPLREGDAHLLNTLRIRVTDSQAELDEQVLHMTKLLIDSLNEREITQAAGVVPEGAKGIGKLQAFFASTNFEGGEPVVQFLKDLQQLRSTGSGHRKGRSYDKAAARIGLDSSRRSDSVAKLLSQAVAMLEVLRSHYLTERSDC